VVRGRDLDRCTRSDSTPAADFFPFELKSPEGITNPALRRLGSGRRRVSWQETLGGVAHDPAQDGNDPPGTSPEEPALV
jgi:hypothetical protein